MKNKVVVRCIVCGSVYSCINGETFFCDFCQRIAGCPKTGKSITRGICFDCAKTIGGKK